MNQTSSCCRGSQLASRFDMNDTPTTPPPQPVPPKFEDMSEEQLLQAAGVTDPATVVAEGAVTKKDKKPKPANLQVGKPNQKHNRLTARAFITQEQFDEDPLTGEASFAALLQGREDPFRRKLKIGRTEKKLSELGCWVAAPGYVLIQNETGQKRLSNPTDEEREKDLQQIITFRTNVEAKPMIVRPGRFAIFEMLTPELLLACQDDEAEIIITVYPK